MIPILYEANETKFLTNGIGQLTDAISCIVTEERNGQYELEMDYPITGIHYDMLSEEKIILAIPFDGATAQPFRIYAISRPLDGVVTVQAQHISYMLKKMVVTPFTATSAVAAMTAIQGHIVGDNPFTFWTDKTTEATMDQKTPVECRSLLGGMTGSVLDVYGGGEYEFDRFTVKLHENRGSDNGVTIRYGKNLTDLQFDVDYGNTYTSIIPYWKNEEEVVVGDRVDSDHIGDYQYQKCITKDFSSDYQDAPTKEQLQNDAAAFLKQNKPWEPNVSVDLSFIPLWQTDEFADTAPLQRVHLCDIVTAEYVDMGVKVTAKVSATVYNVLLERYDSISLGDARASFADAIVEHSGVGEVEEQLHQNSTWLQQAIEHASELLRGGLGGHVVLKTNADGQPEEILIMDTDDINTAQKVWRWNMGGLGYSSTGYNGTYGTAITMEGEIVANWIKTGTLQANLVKAGLLSDKEGKSYWNMETGEMNLVVTKFSLSSGDTIDDIAEKAADAAQKAAEEKAAKDLQNFVDTVYDPRIVELQKQLDGQLETYYYDYEPKADNIPAKDWTTNDLKATHEGDLFYWKTKGYAYRWTKDGNAYSWVRVKDSDVTDAMKAASDAQDTADHKRRVFVNTPTPPYDVGDLWAQGSQGDLLRCKTAKAANGKYDIGDWELASDYIDKVEADKSASAAVNAQTQKSIFDKLTNNGETQGIFLQEDPADHKMKLYINATYLATGILRNAGEEEVFFLDLDNGILRMKASSLSISGKTVDDIADAAASTAADAAQKAAQKYTDDSVGALDQAEVFKRLTDGGKLEGLFMEDGKLYVNASYIKTGTLVLGGANNTRGKLSIHDANDAEIGRWDNAGIYVNGGSIQCKSPDGANQTSISEGAVYCTSTSDEGTSVISIYDGHMYAKYKDTDLGFIGSNGWADTEGIYGINFDLNKDGSYMTWSARTDTTGNYLVKLLYANRNFSIYKAGVLYAGCNMDFQNYQIQNAGLQNCIVSNGIASSHNEFRVGNYVDFDVYSNCDFHNYYIKNAKLGSCSFDHGDLAFAGQLVTVSNVEFVTDTFYDTEGRLGLVKAKASILTLI